ncbi:MAG TPA: triosephosphate isomerase [Candidatus Vogelbacteria bacterium]|nr:triosephosphate isomerase [Candidatus Vogelbacteria bacterium]
MDDKSIGITVQQTENSFWLADFFGIIEGMKINLNKKIIVANWKMNPLSKPSALALYQGLLEKAKGQKSLTIVCPPAVWLGFLTGSRPTNLYLGGQNCSEIKEGAVTGEISAWQLASVGVDFCLVGHSETRRRGEDDLLINQKVKTLLKAGLMVLFCIGEKERDREGKYLEEIKKQLSIGLKGVSKKDISRVIICYEPLFAIGGKRADTPEEFTHSSLFIKKTIGQLYKAKIGQEAKVLYGGSVNKNNAEDFLIAGADGLLVGRESLKSSAFGQIIAKAGKYS